MDTTRNAARVRHALSAVLVAAGLVAAGLAAAGPVHGHGDEVDEGEAKAAPRAAPAAESAQGGHKMMGLDRMSSPDMPNMRMPSMNPTRGRRLFVSKGCVACHAINGVGGHDAPNMDAHEMDGLMNPFDFAAKMWNHAPAMIAAQEEAVGEQIYFTGAELADIIAFVHDDAAQHTFSEHDLTERARAMMQHEHGGKPGPAAHGKELGHDHAPGTAPHKD